ncbi:hypothetical protein SDRG_00007 [Saprolegnia diclina VS20]|uniref:Uncharacterized protein n=1 Tax=Saprolegnia diclina (strain VS20) TaxID=1156394 RepID=T0SH20_SAPDV|nr:hypothetical protein SDRG_00007 [Saprolegnia diclina VS20]EQC42267.1 hypothetical protein SDRG_00007 [Saprolegnia diclina VS20]|eukprot:XP_008603690.1 hypothetical protein SDRG_00007 [Saprolegnia diclina VS20]
MASSKRSAWLLSPPTSRSCSASTVLTNPSLVSAITDYSTNCLAFCPTLYDEDVFENMGMSYLDILCRRHITNGYVDDKYVGCFELAKRAETSVTDHKALYRALVMRQKLAEIIARALTTYKRPPAGSTGHFDFYNISTLLMAPCCRPNPTSMRWGREDMTKLFNYPRDDLVGDRFSIPHGVGWHWYNLSDDGTCAFCTSSATLASNDEEEDAVAVAWVSLVDAHGLHPNTSESWRQDAADALIHHRATHRAFCSNVLQPLHAQLTAHLADVKIVTCFEADVGAYKDSISFLAGVTRDGYIAGVFFEI